MWRFELSRAGGFIAFNAALAKLQIVDKSVAALHADEAMEVNRQQKLKVIRDRAASPIAS